MDDFVGFDENPDFSLLFYEDQQSPASDFPTPQTVNQNQVRDQSRLGILQTQIRELPGMMQSSSLPSSSRDANLQFGQEYPKFPLEQFPETGSTTMQPMILQLFAAIQTMQPSISDMFVEAVKAAMPPLISELVGSFGEAFKTKIQPLISELVAEEMNKMDHSSGIRSSPHQVESSVPRERKLYFVGDLPDTFYTQTKIQEAGTHLRVELRDSSGSRVEIGPECSAKVRLAVLKGDFDVDPSADWTKEEFKKNVVQPRKDKGPLLKGNSEIHLSKGVADVIDIVFTDNSKATRSGTFRLGAELVNGVAREAVSEKDFKVKEQRVNMGPLSLDSDTCRLNNIGKKIAQKLADEKIHTVQDFLQLYHANPNALKKILGMAENKMSEIAKSAKLCLTKGHYLYNYETEGVHLVLDCVFNVEGVTFKGQTSQAYESLDGAQKELVNKLRAHAFETRDQLPRACVLTEQIPVGPSGTKAFANGIQAVSHGTDELRTRSCHAKWTSVWAIVIFKVALKVSVKQGPRATKRQRLG